MLNKSPFRRFVNLTLRFEKTTGLNFDTTTGTYSSGTTEIITIQASVKEAQKPEIDELPAGVPQNSIYFEGYCVEPMSLPEGIEVGSKVKATYIQKLDRRNPENNRSIEGYFTFEPTFQSRVINTSRVTGEKITGYFQYEE